MDTLIVNTISRNEKLRLKPGSTLKTGLHPRIDELEERFVDREQSPKKIARSLKLKEREVIEALLQVGLEVYDECRPDLIHSSKARFTPVPLN